MNKNYVFDKVTIDINDTETLNTLFSGYYGSNNILNLRKYKITELPDYMFYYAKIKEVMLPEGLSTIRDYVGHLSNIEKINIPTSVRQIGSGFLYKSNLYKNDLYWQNYIFVIGNWALDVEVPSGIEILNIPEGIEYLNDGFAYYSLSNSVKTIEFPKSLKSISKNAFRSCSYLESVILSKNIESIKDHAFYGCKSLSNIVFNGTISEWNAIEKEDNWKSYSAEIIVQCTDGQIQV